MRTVSGYLPDNTYPGPRVARTFSSLEPRLAILGMTNDYVVPEATPCYDQGPWGSCVLQSWVGLLETLKGLETGKVEKLSVAWLYAQVSLTMGTFDQDTGTWPYLAGDRIMKIGVVPEEAFPYVTWNLPPNNYSPPGFKRVHPSPSIYIEASDNKVNSMYRLEETDRSALLDQIETSIRANHPVVWGAPVNVSQISNWRRDDPAIDVPDHFDGGHATLLTGVRRYSTGRRDFKVRNSWGTAVGDNGYFWITDNYVAKQGSDFWTGTRMPGLL